MKKLRTRSHRTAEAIAAHEPFTTHGALSAEAFGPGFTAWDSGRLRGDDLDAWRRDRKNIVYLVRSYATPIAWVTDDGRVHKVAQKFSVTTSRHQGNLYLLEGTPK